jgi:hypothetical protein
VVANIDSRFDAYMVPSSTTTDFKVSKVIVTTITTAITIER